MARMTLEEITAKLQAAKDAGKIWNVDSNDIKDALNRHIGDAFKHADIPHQELGGWDMYWELAYPIMACNAHTLLGKFKQLAKLPDTQRWPELKAIVRSLQPVCQLMVEVKPFIVKGRKPAENPSENARTIEHTGTCGCCSRNIKLTASGRIWDHGYEIEGRGRGMHGGYGYKVGGSCFGVGYEPIEVSSKVWIDMQADLERKLVALPERIAGLAARFKALPKPVLEQPWRMTLEQRTERQAYLDLQGALGHAKLCLKLYPARIAELKVSIAEWTARPLPGTSR